LGDISVLGQAVTMVYVLPPLLLPPELEDEPLAQPAIAETEAKATAMAEIVLFPRIYPALLARCCPALMTFGEVVPVQICALSATRRSDAVSPEMKVIPSAGLPSTFDKRSSRAAQSGPVGKRSWAGPTG
jgi:hypothetical protein